MTMKMRHRVATMADRLLELDTDAILNLYQELQQLGSDSDHGMDGDALAVRIVEAAADVRGVNVHFPPTRT